MEFYQLKSFVEVARCGSIAGAAGPLCLSQPAVSAHIKALEELLGLALFERGARGMRLTDAGARLLHNAQQLLEAHDAMLHEAAMLKAPLGGLLKVGLDINTSHAQAMVALGELCALAPQLELSLKYTDAAALLEALERGELDAAFFNARGDRSTRTLVEVELSRFGVVLVAPMRLEAAARELDWETLGRQPWVCPAHHVGCRAALERTLARLNVQPAQLIEVDHERATRALVAAGVGVGLLHSYTAEQAVAAKEAVHLLSLDKSVQVVFAYPQRFKGREVLRRLHQLVERACEEQSGLPP